jgi:hypothetical protein
MVGVGIEMLGLVGEILDDNDAADHENNIFLANDLQLVVNRGRIDAEGSVEGKFERRGDVALLVISLHFGVFLFDCFEKFAGLLCFHAL